MGNYEFDTDFEVVDIFCLDTGFPNNEVDVAKLILPPTMNEMLKNASKRPANRFESLVNIFVIMSQGNAGGLEL